MQIISINVLYKLCSQLFPYLPVGHIPHVPGAIQVPPFFLHSASHSTGKIKQYSFKTIYINWLSYNENLRIDENNCIRQCMENAQVV
jgi:hypothetical protein